MRLYRTFVAAACVLAAPLCADGSRAFAQAQPVSAAAVVAESYDALFQQMFKNPGNLEISFKFAEQAAARGDYEAAIGALERMLFFNPNLPRVKLELGVLYFKLGSWDLARGYFEDAIKGGNVPDDIRAQVNAYLAEITRRQAPYEFSALLHAGARWQSNANVGPNSDIVRAIGQDALLGNQYAKAPDWNWFQLAVAQYNWKINKRGDSIEVIATGYASQQWKFTQFDLAFGELSVGPRIAIDQSSSFKFYGIANGVMLAHHKYIESYGGGFSIRGPMTSWLSTEGFVEVRNRTFFNSDEFPTASQQTGLLWTAGALGEMRYGWARLTGRFAYDRNNTLPGFDYYGYNRWSVDLGLPIEFSVPGFDGQPKQVIVTPTWGYSEARYDDPNWIVDPFTIRKDKETRLGGVIDVQLYQNWGLRTTITQQWIISNIPNYDLKNFTVAFGPTARF